MRKDIFNNYSLTDDETLDVIEQSINIINRNSMINGLINEDLRQEIIVTIYEQLTSGRRKI